MSTGVTYFYLGNFTEAQKHFDKSLKAHEPDAPQSRVQLYGWDTRMVSLTYGAANLWLLGYPARDLKLNHRGSALAQTLANPLNSVIADGMLAGHHQFRTQAQEALYRAESALKAATDYGFTHWIASASITSGWGLAATGHLQDGISRIKQGLKLWKSTGARAELPRFTALFAEACLLTGKITHGLQSIADAIDVMEETNERFYEAELYRLKGELLLKNKQSNPADRVTEAEECFLMAIDVARGQKAKSLELRATMHLCRVWQRQGKEKEAGKILNRIYGWFTEGFDTPDLKAAQELLDGLA
jgi:predicted ATPase